MTTPSFSWPLIVDPPAPVGDDDVQTESVIATARKMLLLRTSVGDHLDDLGTNLGIPRPPGSLDDALYRTIIAALAWQPKTVLRTLYALLGAVFGSQEALVTAGSRPWRVYEVSHDEFIVELANSLLAASNATASYLHGGSGYAASTGSADTFTTTGDLAACVDGSLAGLDLYVYQAGAWTAYTVSSTSYDDALDQSTVVVSPSTLPSGGGYFYLGVSDATSFRGDFVASDGFLGSYSTTGGPPTATLHVRGDASRAVSTDDVVEVEIDAQLVDKVVSTVAYDVATNITTVVLTTADVPPDSAGVFAKDADVVDAPTTPPHDDRVYLTGEGRFEIVRFYIDLLCRAAGVVLRLEIV